MPDDSDPGDETAPGSAPPKRYYAIEEFRATTDTMGLSHHVVARDLMHALEVISRADLSDAVRLEIVEMNLQQAQLLWVRDDGRGGGRRFALAGANLGDHFCEEY